jgi:hypothetical protein
MLGVRDREMDNGGGKNCAKLLRVPDFGVN